jgi:hypothetical protein
MDARDWQVARETVRPRAECPHCNPPAGSLEDEALTLTLQRLGITRNEMRCRAAAAAYGQAPAGDPWPGDYAPGLPRAGQDAPPARGEQYVCPRTCQYADEVGVPGAVSPPCPGGYCSRYAPEGRDDLTLVRVEHLPPWPCCGERGHHHPTCDGEPWSWSCPGCGWTTRDVRLEGHICPTHLPDGDRP